MNDILRFKKQGVLLSSPFHHTNTIQSLYVMDTFHNLLTIKPYNRKTNALDNIQKKISTKFTGQRYKDVLEFSNDVRNIFLNALIFFTDPLLPPHQDVNM